MTVGITTPNRGIELSYRTQDDEGYAAAAPAFPASEESTSRIPSDRFWSAQAPKGALMFRVATYDSPAEAWDPVPAPAPAVRISPSRDSAYPQKWEEGTKGNVQLSAKALPVQGGGELRLEANIAFEHYYRDPDAQTAPSSPTTTGSGCSSKCSRFCSGDPGEQACHYCEAACLCQCAGDSSCAQKNREYAAQLGMTCG